MPQSDCHCAKAVVQPTLVAFLPETEGIKYPIELQKDVEVFKRGVCQAALEGHLMQGQELSLSFAPSTLGLLPE